MKLEFVIRTRNPAHAAHIFHSPIILDNVYGPVRHKFTDWKVARDGAWARDGLIADIEIPRIIHVFAGGPKVTAKLNQVKRIHEDGTVVVHTSVKPSIVGAELVRCQTTSTFMTKGVGEYVTLAVDVESKVFLPPLIKGVVKNFVETNNAQVIAQMVKATDEKLMNETV